MKTLLLTIIFASGTAFAMPNVPEGTYEGKASWKDSRGNKGLYDINIVVEDGQFKATYDYGKSTKRYEFKTKSDADGFFKVESGGQEIGSGYCMNVQCHYTASFGGVELEETLTFWQGNLYRVGSKEVAGLTVAWEEATKKVEQK